MARLPHTRLQPQEAALLAGELEKPTWESKNEGIHERISFEDTIWGFDLAGGAYYKTPLRVTFVKPDSRADRAGIRPGDRLLRINDVDTSRLTIQQAHDIVKESGIHLRLAVTAPEDLEDSYHCWEDALEDGYDSEEERRLEEEKARRRIVRCKTNKNWSLQWPWVSKRRVIYKESNCYLVPSKYEDKHSDKLLPLLQTSKPTDDVVLYSKNCEENKINQNTLENNENQIEKNNNSTDNPKKLTNESMGNEINGNSFSESDVVTGAAAEELSRIKEEEEEEEQEMAVSSGDVLQDILQNGSEMSEEDENKVIEDVLNNNDSSDLANGERL